jgi:hypothetical protein
VLAILIAGGSLWYTRRADERATGAEQTSRRARLVVVSKGSTHTSGQLAPRHWIFGIRNEDDEGPQSERVDVQLP